MQNQPKPLLSKEKILHAARILLQQHGLEEFSMRKLGAELGVQAMSVYRYFPNKKALLDSVLEELQVNVQLPEAGGRWMDRLRLICRAYNQTMQRNAQLQTLLGARESKPKNPLPVMEALHCALSESGMSQTLQVQSYVDLIIFLKGFPLYEAEVSEANSPENTVNFLTQPQTAAYPHLQKIAPKLYTLDNQTQFNCSLDTILSGIKQKLKAEQKTSKAEKNALNLY
ncbi:MAG: TetR/AcrR family transcriptional regulator [Sumerlaeia bacterium]